MLHYVIGISLITIAIIVIRRLSDGKIQRRLQYAIWILIPLYMILSPFIKINVPVSDELYYLFTTKIESYAENDEPVVLSGIEQNVKTDKSDIQKGSSKSYDSIIPASQETYNKKTIDFVSAFKKITFIVSVALIAALTLYNAGFIFYCIRKRRYVGKDPSSGLKIFSIRYSGTPFLLFRKIYVDEASEKLNKYVICHEVCHYKHRDYIWIVIRYLVWAINWYNPVIWIAFLLSGRDCELACDEEVVRVFGEASSKEYAETLLELLQQRSKMSFGFTVSTGMRGEFKMMKKRLENIVKPVRNNNKVLVLSLATLLIFTSCAVAEPAPKSIANVPSSESLENLSYKFTCDEDDSINESSDINASNINYTLNDVDLGQMEDGLYSVAMTSVRNDNEDGSYSYVLYPWTQYEVDKDFIDSLEVGGVLSLPDTLEIPADLKNCTITELESAAVSSDTMVLSQYMYMTEYTGNRLYVNSSSGLNFRETVKETWVLWQYDLPVISVLEPISIKISPDVVLYDAYHFVEDGGTYDIANDSEQLRDVLQFRNTSLTEGYVSSIDEFFTRGYNFIAGENSSFDTDVGCHTLTVIRIEEGEITEIYFYA